MICVIDTKIEYGKQGTLGINLMSELSENGGMTYAHSMDQALAWAKSHAAFADVEPYDLRDGRFLLSSEWMEKPSGIDSLFGSNGATHERQTLLICPVNTVFENTGYKPTAVYTLE